MKSFFVHLVFILAVCSCKENSSQSNFDAIPRISIIELNQNGAKYNGTIVKVMGAVVFSKKKDGRTSFSLVQEGNGEENSGLDNTIFIGSEKHEPPKEGTYAEVVGVYKQDGMVSAIFAERISDVFSMVK